MLTISDAFGLDQLPPETLADLGLLDDEDDDLDDDEEPVVFVRTADAFTKAIRKPWREELHPRGFGGRFGAGQRRHGAGVLDRPSGLGRRDRPAPAPRATKPRLGLQEVPAKLIHAGNNDRKEFDPAKLSELARSIDQDGIAFPPGGPPPPDQARRVRDRRR